MALTYKAKNASDAMKMHENWLKTQWVTVDLAFIKPGEILTKKSKNPKTFNGSDAIDIRVCDLDVTKHFGISLDSIVIDTLQKNPTLMRVINFTQPPVKVKVKKGHGCWGYKEEHLTFFEVRYDDATLYGKSNNKPVTDLRSMGAIELAPLFDIKEIISKRLEVIEPTIKNRWGVFHDVKKSAKRSAKKVVVDAKHASETLIKVDILDLGFAYQSFVKLINSNIESAST